MGTMLPAASLLLALGLVALQDDGLVHGIVRERTSGAPVASYALRLRADEEEQGELVWTDAEGRFTSARAYADGVRLRLTKLDHPGLERLQRTEYDLVALEEAVDSFVRLERERLPLELTTTLGPSYRLQLTQPAGEPLPGLTATLEVQGEPLGKLLRAPVRPGAAPWVRFLPARNDLSADRPWLLRVRRADGLRAAEVVLAPARHAGETPLALELVPTARLDVVVCVTGDAQYFSYAAVQLESVSSGARNVLRATGRSERSEGVTEHLFRSTALAPGDYRVLVLDVLGDRQFVPQAEVTLVAGEAQTVEVDIARGAAPQDD